VSTPSSAAKVNLDTSETLFTFSAALGACGFGPDTEGADPLRLQIRAEIQKNIQASEKLTEFTSSMCEFYRDHQTGDSGRDFAQYVSLALFVDGPPKFKTTLKEAELPPDAVYVLGFLPLVAEFYNQAGLHAIWIKHRNQYNALVEEYTSEVGKMVFDTDIYLKLAFSGYLGRQFIVYLEPLGAVGQSNARNYGDNYYVVLTPAGDKLPIEQIRHTYLHYVLDALALKRFSTIQNLSPLLDVVKTAPMDESFKDDMALLLTESLIRAIEIRTRKAPAEDQKAAVLASMQEGYILTEYFSEALTNFEKDPAGLRDTYPDMLYAIDLGKETRRARNIQFAAQASPELVVGVRQAKSVPQTTLHLAEQKLSTGDISGAQKLAQQALDEKKEDTGYALFILARASSMSRDMEGARSYFERTLEVSKEHKLIAWSHIYLGRIYDLQEDRDSAVEQYKAALDAGDPSPEVKNAAEKGLKQAYEPPTQPKQP
jgi:thioredoxin-like negative regulator of GroEL